jgi:hypothetical protein
MWLDVAGRAAATATTTATADATATSAAWRFGTQRAAPSLPPAEAAHPPPKLLDQLRERLRVQHYALRTERVYVE